MSPFPFSCPETKEPKDMKAPERVDEHPEGRYHLSCLGLLYLSLCFYLIYFVSLLLCLFFLRVSKLHFFRCISAYSSNHLAGCPQ